MLLTVAALLLATQAVLEAADAPRPNILWISCEDTSPWLGFCGEKYASTPNLDRLARGGVHYTNAFVTAPGAAPVALCHHHGLLRHHLWHAAAPVAVRRAGHDRRLPRRPCAGPAITAPTTPRPTTTPAPRNASSPPSWDESSGQAHWRNRKPGQPFFAVFNLTRDAPEQSLREHAAAQARPSERHDPVQGAASRRIIRTRRQRAARMARVHDCITAMDKHAGEILAELEQ